MIIVPYLMTCPERASILAETLESWRQTDWPIGSPRVVVDDGQGQDRRIRQARTAFRLLQQAATEAWDYLLFLEDDLEFNRHIYHNLQTWLPVKYGYARLATLYSTAERGLVSGQHFFCYLAAEHGGSQALLIHRSLLDLIVVSSWNSFTVEMQDVRIASTVSLVDPLVYVFSPNLVQHRQVESTWNGEVHRSPTFQADFRLPSIGDTNMTHLSFFHGLGDAANAAHLFGLYTASGHPITVDCTSDKAPLFLAAGCQVAAGAPRSHTWDHPPGPGAPDHLDHWSGNKVAWNVSRSGLPDIGTYFERWHDLCEVRLDLESQVTDAVRSEVAAYLEKLPRPVVALHTKGNTSPSKKNYPDDLHHDLYREILDRVGGTLLILDWDSRSPWFKHHGVRHMKADWKGSLTTLELYETLKNVDCLVGVDSGVLHFARFTNVPAVGIWTHHHPAHFALPRTQTVHVVGGKHPDWNRRRRLAFNLIEVPGDVPAPWEVAEIVARMIGPRKFVDAAGPDVVLQSLLDRCRSTDHHHPYRDRHRTFSAFLEPLRAVSKPVVVETGCIRSEEDFSAGFSSYIFGLFLKYHGGELQSVDIDAANCNFARKWCQGLPVTVAESDSRPWLTSYQGGIDALYLDSADVNTESYQDICLEEAQKAMQHLSPSAPILIDDSPYAGGGRFDGKGGLAIPWLLEQGFKIKLAGYQVLLSRQ